MKVITQYNFGEQSTTAKMALPTQKEINPIAEDLDGQWAVKMFHGKSLEAAEGLFRKNGISRVEDLMWMGAIGFVFYFSAALAYLKGEYSRDDSDFVNSMVGMLEFRIGEEFGDAAEIVLASFEMTEFCEYVIEYYSKFDLNPEIYGNLRPRLHAILEKLR